VADEPVSGRDYPRNQEEFRRFFSTERACLLFLSHLRWRDGFECPSCGHDRYWQRGDGLFLCCGCRRQTSPTAGTVLDKTRLPLSKWLQAMWYVTEETGGVSALSLQRALGLGSYETAWAMLHKLRRAMEPTSGLLEGTVEVDESFVGGEEMGVRGRYTEKKAKVIIAV
jgi:transposase-like protein